MAAYQALGQFISTFAEPERSGFDIDENGMLVRCQKLNLTTTTTATSDRDSPLPPLEDPSLESDRLSSGLVIFFFVLFSTKTHQLHSFLYTHACYTTKTPKHQKELYVLWLMHNCSFQLKCWHLHSFKCYVFCVLVLYFFFKYHTSLLKKHFIKNMSYFKFSKKTYWKHQWQNLRIIIIFYWGWKKLQQLRILAHTHPKFWTVGSGWTNLIWSSINDNRNQR